MRRLAAIVLVGLLALLGFASQASAAAITNGTVTLGVNPQGDLNDMAAAVGLTYNDTGNDGTIQGSPAEGWGAGADGPLRFQGRANERAGNDGYAVPVTFTSNATDAVSVVDILRGRRTGAAADTGLPSGADDAEPLRDHHHAREPQ